MARYQGSSGGLPSLSELLNTPAPGSAQWPGGRNPVAPTRGGAAPWPNDFGGGGALAVSRHQLPPQYEEALSSESSSEEISVQTIIRDKPKPKVVREFMRDVLAGIQGEDEVLFA